MAGTPKLRVGLFGTGYWARQVHAAGLTAAPEARLVGVWGRDRFRTAASAAPYGIAAYDDAEALIQDVDAVSIALPPDMQVPVAVGAARAGRHLLLEEPLALPASGADELLGAVTSAGVASVVFFTSRFVSAVDQVLRDAAVTGGWYGARGTMLSCISGNGSPYAKSAWRHARGGLWDHDPHMMSLFLPVLGPAEEVTAVQGQHQTSHILVRHASGAVSALVVSLNVPKAFTGLDVAFLGDSGSRTCPSPVPSLFRHWPEQRGNWPGPLPGCPGAMAVTSGSAGR